MFSVYYLGKKPELQLTTVSAYLQMFIISKDQPAVAYLTAVHVKFSSA